MYERKDEKIGSFSGGMKQRIGIALILLHLPRILVVDEPTAGLDPRERIRFRNLLVELVILKLLPAADLLQPGYLIRSLSLRSRLSAIGGRQYAVAALATRPLTGRLFDTRGENVIFYPILLLTALSIRYKVFF